MEQNKEYYAFISYKSEDAEWAIWLQHELEHYHLPTSFNGNDDVRQELRPVFRDIDELSAGNLPDQIKRALVNSQNLIVVCSPQAAKSPWVNQEVETFISLGKTECIFPFIVEGTSPSEFFPPALLNLPKNKERLGGDVSKNGRDAAFVKVVAGMIGVGFDSLWNRYEKEKAEEERKVREQRDNLFKVQSRFLSEKVSALVKEGNSYTARLLALEALPKDLQEPDRPNVIEAEIALRKAWASDNRIFKGHTGGVTSIDISPNGNMLASASLDNFIRLWDIRTGKCLFKLEKPSIASGKFRFDLFDGLIDEIDHLGFVSVSFSPGGDRLVSVAKDSTIYVWDLKKRECITKIFCCDIHESFFHAIFSPNGNFIISCGSYISEENEFCPSLIVWDAETGARRSYIDTHDVTYYANYSDDKKKIATVGHYHIDIWDSEKRSRLCHFKYQHQYNSLFRTVNCKVIFSPDGNLVAASSDDTARIWDVNTKKRVQTIKTRNSSIKSVIFSKDGLSLITGGMDNVIKVWDIKSGRCINTLIGHTGEINSIINNPQDNIIISGSDDYTIRIWDMTSNKSILSITIPDKINHANYNVFQINEKNKLVMKKGGLFEIVESLTNNVIKTFPQINLRPASERGPYNIQNIDKTRTATYKIDHNTILIEDIKNDLMYSLKSPHLTEVQHMAFSPDGDSLLSVSSDNEFYISKHLQNLANCVKKDLKITDLGYWVKILSEDEQNLQIFKGHSAPINYVSFSPDGKLVASTSQDMTIRIWDVTSGECIQVLSGHDYSVEIAEVTPDGRFIISVDQKTIKVWSFPTLQELINKTYELFKDCQLSDEERSRFFLD